MSADTFFTCKSRRPDFRINEGAIALHAFWTGADGVGRAHSKAGTGYNERMVLIKGCLEDMDAEDEEVAAAELAAKKRRKKA